MKNLLILDINGLICCKVKPPYQENLTNNYIARNHYRVYFRDNVKEFIKWCLENYNVGIWSSTNNYNVYPILKHVLDQDIIKKFLFIWCRDRTRLDLEYPNNNIKKFDTIKDLKDIWSCPTINCEREYDSSNTLLIDDSYQKTRFNSSDNLLIVNSFDINNPNLDIISDIENSNMIDENWYDELKKSIQRSFENLNDCKEDKLVDKIKEMKI